MNAISGFTHDSANNKTIDWYTPKHIFDSMGLTFDLDPCAPVTEGNAGVPWIPAKKVFTLVDNGLTQSWGDPATTSIWLNPPYGRETITPFSVVETIVPL